VITRVIDSSLAGMDLGIGNAGVVAEQVLT
jgi:hypothetical protein